MTLAEFTSFCDWVDAQDWQPERKRLALYLFLQGENAKKPDAPKTVADWIAYWQSKPVQNGH